MSTSIVTLGYEYFPDPTKGRPVFNGSIFVGIPGTDPTIVSNQKQVTLIQEDGTNVEVAQPVLTGGGGVPLYNGSPVAISVAGNYSLTVLNNQGSQVYYVPNASNITPPFVPASSFTESQTLTSGQTVVTFSNDTTDAFFYVVGDDADNGRLDPQVDFTLDTSTDTVTLAQSYPAGTILMMGFLEAVGQPVVEGTYNSVSEMKSASIDAGSFVATKGYYTAGDGGSAFYYIQTSGDFGGTPDGFGDHVIGNGNVAALIKSPKVDIRTYGASTSQDAVTNGSAINACISANSNSIVPEGVFLSSALSRSEGFTLEGLGIGLSVLQFSGSNGLSISLSNDESAVSLKGLSFHTADTTVANTAITIDGTGQVSGGVIQNRTSPRLVIENLSIRGNTSVSTDGWSKGVDCINIMHATVNGLHFEGKYGASQSDVESLSGISFSGSGSPVEIIVNDSWVFYAQDALTATDCEGVFVSKCNFIAVDTGIRFNPAATEPQLSVTNSHINSNKPNIICSNLSQGVISGNLLYARTTATANLSGITLADCTYTNITNNTFVNNSGFNYDCIVFSTGGADCSVNNNVIQSGTTGVWLQPGSSGINVGRNVYGALTTNVLNDGSNNVTTGHRCVIRRNTTFNLPDNALTAIPFEAVFEGNSEFFNIGNPTRLTAPVAGWYRLGGGVVYDINATGYRRMQVQKNGSPVLGFPNLSLAAGGTVNDAVTTSSKMIKLAVGDYIELYAAQNSGAPMTLPVAETFLSIEWIGEPTVD